MLSLPALQLAANVLPRAHAYVYVRELWADDWIYVPYLRPVVINKAAAPEFGEVGFRYYFGTIKREDSTTFADYLPNDLLDWYVQVRTLVAGAAAEPVRVWTGVIVRDRRNYQRGDRAQGVQEFRAAGIGKLWDRKKIRTGHVIDRKRDGDVAQEIGWAPDFNERADRFGQPILGNRNEDPVDDPDATDDDFDFGIGGTWNALQAVRHIIRHHTPEQFGAVDLVGQPDILRAITGVWRQAGKTPWEILLHIMDRRFSIGWMFDVEGDDDAIVLRIFSTAAVQASYGRYTLDSAAERIQITIPDTFPWSHLIDDVPIDRSSEVRVETILVRGARIVQLSTIKPPIDADSPGLVPVWTDTIQAAYDGATGDEDDKKHERARDRYHRVYSAFAMEDGWLDQDLIHACTLDGSVEVDPEAGVWHGFKTFLRTLPLKAGVRYDGASGPVDENEPDAEPEFLPTLGLYQDAVAGPNHTRSDKWLILERMQEMNEDLQSCGIRTLDREPGIEVHATPRHYFALNHWGGETTPDTEPELDYEYLRATVAWRTDHHLQVTVQRPPAGDHEREVVIDIPEAEYWIATPGTIADVRDGEPVFMSAECWVIRDDTEYLRVIACFASVWWFTPRQPISLTIKGIVQFPIGALLDELSAGSSSIQPNTTVTGWSQHWDSPRTTILETGYTALDAAGLAQAVEPLGRYKKVKTAGMRHA